MKMLGEMLNMADLRIICISSRVDARDCNVYNYLYLVISYTSALLFLCFENSEQAIKYNQVILSFNYLETLFIPVSLLTFQPFQ